VRKKRYWFAVPLLVLALVAAAGGDDDSDDNGSTATTAAPGGTTGETGGDGGGDCSLDGPVKIVGLAEKPPEGPNAIPDTAEGWEMALEEIGDTVCGQPLEFERFPASPTDGAAATNAYLQALDEEPAVIIGLPSSTAVLAAAPEVAKNGVPTIFMALAPQAFADAEAGSEWGFTIRPRNTSISTEVVKYAVEDLGAKRIALLCANNAFGTSGCDAAAAAAEDEGVEIVARESNETTDTDLTAKVTAIKNSNPDVVIAATFPNNLAVFYNQAADADLNVPIFGGSSAGLIQAALNADSRANAWGTDDCVPASDPDTAEWKAKYEEKFGKKMIGSGYAVAEAYDALMFSVKAIEEAGSTDPDAVAEAMRTLEYDGVCTTYKADAGQGLHHATDIVKFDAEGVGESQKLLTLEAS
jgi:branched-chain amino acid transport system substrate-binding protein